MSRNIDQLFVDFFDAEVKRAYQDTRKLGDKVYTKTGVVGKTARFQKAGTGIATLHNPGADVTAMNTEFSFVTCTLQDWEAVDYADKFDSKKINFSEVTELAEVAAKAVGRRMDQIIIDAMDAGYDATGSGLTADNEVVGTTNTALSVATLRSAKEALDDANVPTEERYFAHTSAQLNRDLLAETSVTSSDYNSVKALVHGDVGSFLGFKFILIGSRSENGLPSKNGTTDRMGFIWHKRAVGQAIGMDINTEMCWIPEKRAYMVLAEYSSGAVVIDPKGVVGVLSKA